MRLYGELSEAEQKRAFAVAQERLLRAIVAGAVRFDDAANEEDLQAHLDAAIGQAEALGTPWFAPEYVLDAARAEIGGMAQADAEGAFYPDLDDLVLYL